MKMKCICLLLTIGMAHAVETHEQQAAKAIADYATYLIRSMDDLGKPMLDMSLKLDPECEQALLVKGLLARKMRPDKVETMTKIKVISGISKRGEQLLNSKDPKIQQLGCLYVSGGLKLDPKNKKLIMLHTKAKTRGLEVDFDKIIGRIKFNDIVIPNRRIPADAVVHNKHHYKVIDEHVDWNEADKYCKSIGGYLVSITTKEEDAFITSICKSSSWIGAIKDPQWKWTNGEKWSYTNFNRRSRGRYSYHRGANGDWGLMPTPFFDTNSKVPFICEWDFE